MVLLDMFNYRLNFVGDQLVGIDIQVEDNTDVTISDISTELVQNDFKVYVEGFYGHARNIRVEKEGILTYLKMDINQTGRRCIV